MKIVKDIFAVTSMLAFAYLFLLWGYVLEGLVS